jgi:hypothetical protein
MGLPTQEELDQHDEELIEALGVYHGLPLGFGVQKIESNAPHLRHFFENAEKYFAARGMRESKEPKAEKGDAPGEYVRHWATSRPWRGRMGTVVVYRDHQTGKLKKAFAAQPPHWAMHLSTTLETIAMLRSYGVLEAEEKARERLRSEISEEQWREYVLSDSFFEIGKSGVEYILRRNRPTIAMRRSSVNTSRGKPLCTLCLHPIAYYTGTWAGSLPPSDEVLSHLLMIRADEHLFWRKANQHPLSDLMSGIG